MAEQMMQDAAGKAIPVGYKQTEVGVIPEDWEIKTLGELVDIYSGESPSKFNFTESGIPYFKVEQLNDGLMYADETPYFIDTQKTVRAGSVIFPKRGASILLNKIRLLKRDSFMDTNLMALTCSFSLDALYLYNQLIYKKLSSVADTTSIPQINNKHITPYAIPFPTKQEQTAIANVLSDSDALIDALEQLIAKKQAIKSATMQQLLTGRTRLPAFALRPDGTPKGYKPSELGDIPDDWEVVSLGDVIQKVTGGGTPSRANPTYWGNEIPWVTVKDFATFNPSMAQEYITKTGLANSSSNLIPRGTLITSTRMALGKAVVYDVDVAINQDLKAIFPNSDVVVSYLFYWFELNAVKIDDLGSGSTVKGLSLGDLRNLSFLLLSSEEQTAIATILSDMDNELQALTQKLDKARALKQGMMQQLLTGKIRLPLAVGA
ncbi:restriction endonuclease subunit S [Aeromonas dhakensis]|uniref:restriction endonuclease subunit S n=1 Tax=Aeromonas TaxID=642 RepID=UPI00191FADE7|nr:restriction endonuclease subunit S [Aeromonas dhakensis]MBL0463143.1 restriction endonuclease subunit S [Aeromonas dhakensis]MBL0604394.1 restriction endonuclease subunit S [Aeromonas dhakensis]MBL0620989.1 restriction endonuclease subunit S [Aeromonas dhakensis]BEJ50601.1 restriction endonuclease subunit S [Aeromonas dhakensis]HDT5886917.1 restriction endonuclease subunit S [Aeromonas dhakensis]